MNAFHGVTLIAAWICLAVPQLRGQRHAAVSPGPKVRSSVGVPMDAQALHILASLGRSLRDAHAVTATVERESSTPISDGDHALDQEVEISTVTLLRPGYARTHVDQRRTRRIDSSASHGREVSWRDRPVATQTVVLTPNGGWERYNEHDTVATALDSTTDVLEATVPILLRAFFPFSEGRFLSLGEWDGARLTDPLVRSVRYVGVEEWRGASYDVIDWVQELDYSLPHDARVFSHRLYVGPDGIVHRIHTTSPDGGWIDQHIASLTLNAPLTDTMFPPHPPAGTRLVRRGPTPFDRLRMRLAVGETFPSFTAAMLDGRRMTRERLVRGKKAVVLWMWAYACVPCRAYFPYMQQLYDEYRSKGVDVIAYDYEPEWAVAEERVKARGMLAYNQADMPILFRGTSKLNVLEHWGVILDGHGRVVRSLEYDVSELRAVLDRLITNSRSEGCKNC